MGAHTPSAPLSRANPASTAPGYPEGARFPRAIGGRTATRLVAVLGVVASLAGGAAAAEPPVRDFAAGVAKFHQLGLADVGQAKYVRLESGAQGLDNFSSYGGGPKLTGNAWLLSTKPDGTAVVLLDQLRVVEVVPAELAKQRRQGRLDDGGGAAADDDESGEPGAEVVGTWKEADLAADIRAVTEYLARAESGNDYALRRTAAALFLFAAQVHSHGQAVEANRIIALLFERVGDSRKVLGAAMDRMANDEYVRAHRAFAAGGEWSRYLAAMEAQLARFGPVWRREVLVSRVAEAVRGQLAQGPAAAPVGEGLTEEDRRLAELWAKPEVVVSLGHAVFGGGAWLLADPVAANNGAAAGSLDLIQRRGVAVIPLLVALLPDQRLVRTAGERWEVLGRYDSDTGPLREDEVEREWGGFPRPWTRGELARRILLPLVTNTAPGRGEEAELTDEELAQKARDWYAQHKGDDRATLRRVFLAAGRTEVIWQALNSSDPADQSALEAYLLSEGEPLERFRLAMEYAQRRGAAAGPFVRQYVAGMRKAFAAMTGSEPASEAVRQERTGQFEAMIKTLEDLVSETTGLQVLQELLTAENPRSEAELEQLIQPLLGKLARDDISAVHTALLQGCVDAKDDRLADFCLRCLGYDKWARARDQVQSGRPATVEAPGIETQAARWRQVMARKRPAAGVVGSEALGFEVVAAGVIEGLYGGDESETANPALVQVLGDRLFGVMVQRAKERLAGKPAAELTAFPNKARVSAARTGEIARLLQAATAENAHEVAAQLSLDELLVVPGLVGTDPQLSAKLAPGTHVVREVRLPPGNEALAALCLPLKGKVLDRALLETLIAECRRQAAQGTDVSVLIERRAPLAGVVLKVGATASPPEPVAEAAGSATGAPPATLMAVVQSEGADRLQGYGQFPIGAPPTPAAAKPEPAVDDDQLPGAGPSGVSPFAVYDTEFWANFQKLFAPDFGACVPYQCLLLVQHPQPRPQRLSPMAPEMDEEAILY